MPVARNSSKLLIRTLVGGLIVGNATLAHASMEQLSILLSPPVITNTTNLVLDDGETASARTRVDGADASPAGTVELGIPVREAECIAKVVVHEAGNQPRKGQIAVAQVVRSRMKDKRFAPTACGVVKQRGQFFDVDAYNPPRDEVRWVTAMRIAYDTLNDQGGDVANGALFFRSGSGGGPGRVRVAQIADHIFYR